jgi:hypothetical protein
MYEIKCKLLKMKMYEIKCKLLKMKMYEIKCKLLKFVEVCEEFCVFLF